VTGADLNVGRKCSYKVRTTQDLQPIIYIPADFFKDLKYLQRLSFL